MTQPFFIAALPRSRTAWMAAYLTQPGVLCYHERMKHCATRESFFDSFREPGLRVGNSDSGLIYTGFQDVFPNAPTVVIERPVDDVADALRGIDIDPPIQMMRDMHARLKRIRGLRVAFEHLDRDLSGVCEHLGVNYDRRRHEVFAPLIVVTTDFHAENYGIWSESWQQ